ncbi:MAG: hypothetical protein LBS26_02855 [Campylobacteraceae bacterium]|jgi:uncharacterized protein (UPF0248 family)|nr:hypothetical protein [Campylobacteraceae bacterium]
MKKIFAYSIALVLALVFNGCEDKKSNTNGSNTVASNTTVCTGGGIVKHGYQLPPCPDPIENDKTLLGVDTNNNGVRDDVEIWIYHTYDTYKNCTRVEVEQVIYNGTVLGTAFKTVCSDEEIPYHQIVREIAMQWARTFQIVIQEPEKARETVGLMHNAIDCEWYFGHRANKLNEPILIDDYNLYKELDNIQFNTIQRARAYSEYNFHLGGGVYGSTPYEELRSKCDFNINALLGK